MALSLGSLLRRFRRAPQLPNIYRYNPESVGVGILLAVEDPAAARLRVVGPLIHSCAQDILDAALLTLCCSHGHGRPFRAAVLSCGLCSHWISGGNVYMYKGEIGFCKPECRYDYITEELHRVRQKRVMSRGREKVPTMVDDKDSDTGSIFFTCTDIL
ncbi:unnamed protein product [Alopecurus aequalis]